MAYIQEQIRRVNFEDAEALADLKIALSHETDFIPFLELERDTLISTYAKLIT